MKLLLAVLLLACVGSAENSPSTTGDAYLINNLRMGYRNMPWKIDGKTYKVKRGHYQVVKLDPGRHAIQFDGGKTLALEIKPGESSYLAPEERAMGFGGFQINMLAPESAKFQIDNLQSQ